MCTSTSDSTIHNISDAPGAKTSSVRPRLSIIIPVYNTEPYLRRCLQSVVVALDGLEDQAEVLIINDGSPDHSQDIIDEFCDRYGAWMRCCCKENGGLADVKNYGLQRVQGNYVIFLDSDDYVEPNMYRCMLDKADNEHADVVVCDIRLVYDDETQNVIHSCTIDGRQNAFWQLVDYGMMPASWNKLVRRELYEGLSFPTGLNNEDVAVTPIVMGRAQHIVATHETYYNYYQRANSIQQGSSLEQRFVIIRTARICLDRMVDIPADRQEFLRGSIYVHQVLAIPFYLIRQERFRDRYRLLRAYMPEVERVLPEIWKDREVRESYAWGGFMERTNRSVSFYLLRHRWYLMAALFWGLRPVADALRKCKRVVCSY